MTQPKDLPVTHLPERHRFEIRADDLAAELTYALHGDTLTFVHTGVPSEWEGQGIGSKLARAGLDHARANGYKIHSICPFISSYLKRHPEYQT